MTPGTVLYLSYMVTVFEILSITDWKVIKVRRTRRSAESWIIKNGGFDKFFIRETKYSGSRR